MHVQRPSTWGHLGGKDSPLDGWNSCGNQGVNVAQTVGLAQSREGVCRSVEARYSQKSYNLGQSGDSSNNNDRDNGLGVVLRQASIPWENFSRDAPPGGTRADITRRPQEGQGYEPRRKDRKPAPYDGKFSEFPKTYDLNYNPPQVV